MNCRNVNGATGAFANCHAAICASVAALSEDGNRLDIASRLAMKPTKWSSPTPCSDNFVLPIGVRRAYFASRLCSQQPTVSASGDETNCVPVYDRYGWGKRGDGGKAAVHDDLVAEIWAQNIDLVFEHHDSLVCITLRS